MTKLKYILKIVIYIITIVLSVCMLFHVENQSMIFILAVICISVANDFINGIHETDYRFILIDLLTCQVYLITGFLILYNIIDFVPVAYLTIFIINIIYNIVSETKYRLKFLFFNFASGIGIVLCMFFSYFLKNDFWIVAWFHLMLIIIWRLRGGNKKI